jgi:hypothetical protein
MLFSEHVAEISERLEKTGIGLKDALSIIDLTFEDQIAQTGTASPYEAFEGLNELIDLTVHGSKIERFKPRKERQPFHTLEIYTEDGEAIAYLNMIYLGRKIPCYYLVYVEVLPSFRRLGLGNRILTAFMGFVKERKTIGLLDNIIPQEDPTYEIYGRLGWKKIKEYINGNGTDEFANYMVFIPDSVQTDDFKNELIKILFSLKKKRPVIDMHDNEDMVKRTIEEFRSAYGALLQLFDKELSAGTSNPLMRFMFTRLTTKLLGFRRRISTLIGYTGGESLEQISFDGKVKEMPIQPYSLWNMKNQVVGIWGEKPLLQHLPDRLKEEPTLFIEALPLYKRPYLREWMERNETLFSADIKITDLLDLGFDPTRLREWIHGEARYIFERISPHFFPALVRKRRFLKRIEKRSPDLRVRSAAVLVNPPLLLFRDRGNIYALRKKVEGVHLEEALDQLKTAPHLKEMNRLTGIDSALMKTIHEIKEVLKPAFSPRLRPDIENLTYFIPWDIEKNIPLIQVDDAGIFLSKLWLA